MTTPAFTARNVSKFIAKSIVAAKTTQLSADAIADHTHYEKDDTVVEIGSGVIGWFASSKLEPVTDTIVDKTADFVTAQRAKRQEKKSKKNDNK